MGALTTTETLPLTGCDRSDIESLIETSELASGAVDGVTLKVVAGVAEAAVALPRWEKFTVDFEDLAALGAVLSGAVTLFTLQDGGVIHAVKAFAKTAFSGGSVSALSGTVGIAGTVAKYLTAYDLVAAAADSRFGFAATAGAEAHTLAGGGAGTAILLTVTAVGDNLDQLAAGSCDIWVLWSATV